MSDDAFRGRARIGQIATLGLLAVAAFASAWMQRGGWWTAPPSPGRIVGAIVVLLAWTALCVALL
ncbi:MAG TPA: hypothetical protein VFE72_11180, partial [Lysobacter sp.]|nr:hypothetical protein [Lysobacter sp.]